MLQSTKSNYYYLTGSWSHEQRLYFISMQKRYVFIAQYPVRWTAQSALHFTPDLFIPKPTRLL